MVVSFSILIKILCLHNHGAVCTIILLIVSCAIRLFSKLSIYFSMYFRIFVT